MAKMIEVRGNGAVKMMQQAGKKLFQPAKRVILRGVTRTVRDVRKRFKGFDPNASKSRNFLMNRSGQLKRSVGHKVQGSNLASLVGSVFAFGAYARAQEYGRKPVNSKRGKKFYVIPAEEMLTKAGVQKRPIGSWRGDKRAFFMRSKRGHLMFVMRRGKSKRAKIRILYNLFRFPTKPIPPRLGIRDSVKTYGKLARVELAKAARAVLGA